MNEKYTNSNCIANYGVIAIIPILFFLFTLFGYIGIIPLHVPLHASIIIAFILFIFLFFIKHNANYSICKIRASYYKLEENMTKALKLNELTIKGKTKSVLDIRAYLNSYFEDVRNDNFASVASSIFPMLGILGTFTAIAISMPNFSVSTTAALDNEISALLSGVGSAFYASIYGILLSLLWTYFEKRGVTKIEHYFASIEDTHKTKVYTKEELLIYKYTQYDTKENKFIGALKETFSLEFIENLNKEHLVGFQKIMNASNHIFAQIADNLQSVSSDMTKNIEKIDLSTHAVDAQMQMNNSIEKFTQATESFEKNSEIYSEQLNNSLNLTFDKIDNEIGQIVIKLADFATHVSKESLEVQESIGKYHKRIAKEIE